jgi:hypothetical protein
MFIYAYREVATGRAVYVGCANNVKRRDQGHCADTTGDPIDREISRVGRDAFTIETLEEVTPENCVARENYWMDKLGTFRTAHGFNSVRAKRRNFQPEHKTVLIHVTDEQFERLAARRAKTHEPTSSFVRRMIEKGLHPTGIEKILEEEVTK